ncbi:MAG: toxin-antitoxin system HicB family antitoxin [Acidobacteriota bacterium]|nr:toxin-antitoxin system HicB family antitoxin [Acidobacteriota bacterium]MDE2965045.1 toxin-antitoxin system HicB family antitoxin [Acidobacteriota bacterium]
MANLQVRNIPDELHERLRRHARENHCTLSASVLAALERELARWEWRKHLARRPKTSLGVPAVALLMEERSLRDPETG